MDRKEKTILVTLCANGVLIALRFSLATMSGSIGLQANAWHSLTDFFVTFVVWIGLIVTRLGGQRIGRAFKKQENLLAIFVSLFIFYMGLEILGDALAAEQTELRYVPFTAAGAFLGVIINYFMARYKIYVGEQTGSQSLIADGCHSKMDMYCSIAVLVGILGSLFGMPDLDKAAAIVAMVLLVMAGWEILSSNLHQLRSPEEAREENAHTHGTGKKAKEVLIATLTLAYLLSGVYLVSWDETAVVRTFGKVTNRSVPPGIHYRLPAPFGKVTLVKSENVMQIKTNSQELLTGDTNLVNVDAAVQFRINDAADYALNMKAPAQLVRSSAVSTIRQIVGQSALDDILTVGRKPIEEAAMTRMNEILTINAAGIEVVGVQLVTVSPPSQVMASFQDLASARQDRSIFINQAISYRNTIVPQARAEAYQLLVQAQGYKDEKIKTATGDSDLFSLKQQAYSRFQRVTNFRLYLEAMDKVLPNVKKVLLGEGVKVKNADFWLNKSDEN